MAFSTIGDSFSVVATLGGIAVTAWSFNVTCALLFPDKVESARIAVSTRMSSVIGKGFLSLLVGVASFLVIQIPNGLFKLLGTIMLAAYFALVAVGISGIAKLAAERMQSLKQGQSNLFDSFAKASMYLVLAAMLPVLGWFLLAPLLVLFGGGAGLIAILKPAPSREVA